MSPSWLFRFHTKGLFCRSGWSRQKRKHQKLCLQQCFCSDSMFTVGRAARGAENLGQKKVTTMGDGQLSKGDQKSDIFGLLRLFRSEVKYSSFCKKIRQHNSLGRYNDYHKQFSDPTQPGKYHLSTFSSWGESRCGIVLMLSEHQWIVQLLDMPLFLKNVVLCHSGKLGEVRGDLDMYKPIISGGDIKLGDVPTTGSGSPATWQILWRLIAALHPLYRTESAQKSILTCMCLRDHHCQRMSFDSSHYHKSVSDVTAVGHFYCSQIQGFLFHGTPQFFRLGRPQVQPLCRAVSALKSEQFPGALDSLFLKTLHFPHKDPISDIWVTWPMNTHHNVSQQSIRLQQPWPWDLLCWSEHAADNTEVVK